MSIYASRAGDKLAFALKEFKISVKDKTCADFGSSTGGFVDVLLKSGARKVYAVETGYGVLDWKLRKDQRVVVMERTNALHVRLPEKVDLITIDISWTRQAKILPVAFKWLKPGGDIISLLKPQYEAEARNLQHGKLTLAQAEAVAASCLATLDKKGIKVRKMVPSPLPGEKGGNQEFLLWLVV